MEISIENSLINGESIFKTIGKVLIQVQSNSAGGQTSREIDFKTLAEREATSENLEALITSLKDLLPEDVQAFADGLIGLGPEGAKLLESLIIKNRLENFDLSGLSSIDSKTFADRLIKLGPEGIKLLTTLIERYRLENFDLSGLSSIDSKTFADRMIGLGPEGIKLLKSLIIKNKLNNYPSSGLSPAVSQAFADRLIKLGPEGIKLLESLIIKNRLENYPSNGLSPEDAKDFADGLIELGPEGIKLLTTLIERYRLENFDLSGLSPEDAQAFADWMIGLGPEGIKLLESLIIKNRLENYPSNGLSPEDAQAFADGLIKLGPEGAKLLESLIIKNRLNNFDLNGFSLSASQDFADGLIKLGPEGIKLLTTLIEQYRLENFDLSGLSHVDSITFADSLIKCRKIGTQCLKALIEHRRIPINFDLNGLSPIDSKTFACMLIECGPEGAEYLKFLVKQKRLSTLALSVLPHDDFKNFTKTLIECGPEGAECLRFLVEQKRLFPSLRALQPNQSQALTAQLIKLGPKGAECLRFLAEQNSLFPNLSALQPNQSQAFADGLIKLGPKGAECLRFLVEQNRLPTLVLSALQPNQSQAFANRLLKCGPEGAKCLRFLVEQKRLPTLVLSALPSDQSQAFEYRLLKCGPEGVEYLKFLVEQKRLPTLVLSALPHDNFKDFAKALIECGPEGTEYLKFLVEQNKGSASFTEEESQDLAEIFIHESKFGIECLKSWVGKGMLPNLKLCKLNEEVLLQFDLNTLPKEQVTGLAKALLDSSNPSDLSLLGRLIEWNKLSFDPNFKLDISLLRTNSNAFAVALAGGGAFSLALLAQLMDVSKGPTLDLSDLSYVSSQAFADRLLGCSSSGANFLVELIEQNKLPNLLFPEDMKARAIRFRDLHSTFEGGIKKAFFGKTDSIDYKSWTSIRTRLQDMSLGEARGIWRTITNEVAVNCFDADGNVDVEKLKGWMEFFGNVETFRTIPYRFIPIVELMRSQMYTVCECLVLDRNDVMKQLNAANSITVGQNGRFILAAISQGRQSLLSLTQAILASLFTPHRQNGLIACTIHSLINAEIRNHPERLIQIYIQMLNGNQFTFPSGYVVLQEQSIMDNFIIVDLQNGKRGRNEIFANMTSIDPSKVAQQREIWQQEGISVEAKYKLRMPVHNINDLLFAHLFQRSNFGNCEEYASDYGTTLIYAGHSERDGLFTQKIQVDESNFLDGIKKLKEQAETQRQNLGHRYMRVVTTNHAENIDIAALLALDLDNMETEKAYPIGDRNWCNRMSQDIPRLAFRKKGGEPPIYEWGTLRGHLFDPKAISTIHVFDTSIKVFSPITT